MDSLISLFCIAAASFSKESMLFSMVGKVKKPMSVPPYETCKIIAENIQTMK